GAPPPPPRAPPPGAGPLAPGRAVGAAPAAAQVARSTLRLGRRTYRVGYGGGTSEAVTSAAYNEGFFAREGIHVTLTKGILGADQAEALTSGIWDAVPSNFYSWLKPIE